MPVVALVDELWSGVPVAGASSVESEFGLSHTAYVVFVFAAPLIVASVLEGGLAFLSDVLPRRRLMFAGQTVLGASLWFVGSTRSAWTMAIGLAMAGTSSGIACSAAQAIEVRTDPRGPERAMVRWSLYSCAGDLLAPLVTAGSIALGCSYRGAMRAIGAAVIVQAVVAALAGRRARHHRRAHAPPRADADLGEKGEPATEATDDEAPADPLGTALRRALRSPALWAWLFAAATCTLLDELVVALACLRLDRDQGTSAALAAATAATFAAGSMTGAALADRFVARFGSRRVLLVSALLCTFGLALLGFSRGPITYAAALFVVGVTAAPHHPLAFARAYEQMPANPGTVQACAQLLVFIDVAAPIALGFVADRFGLHAALACLVVQPAVIFGCAAWIRKAGA